MDLRWKKRPNHVIYSVATSTKLPLAVSASRRTATTTTKKRRNAVFWKL